MGLCRRQLACHTLWQALSEALKQWPEVNSSLGADGVSLVQHASHDIGVAIATPNGLVVPAIKVVVNAVVVEQDTLGTPLLCTGRAAQVAGGIGTRAG